MRETCRLCHGSLAILIMVLIPSSKSQVISAAMWLRLEIIICLVLLSTGAPQRDLQSCTCTYAISLTDSCQQLWFSANPPTPRRKVNERLLRVLHQNGAKRTMRTCHQQPTPCSKTPTQTANQTHFYSVNIKQGDR